MTDVDREAQVCQAMDGRDHIPLIGVGLRTAHNPAVRHVAAHLRVVLGHNG